MKLIGPSLEKHKGCDILDLNPGAGLWSQKLHEFLHPRSHILLEPQPELYGQFLQPLVDTPGSTFQLATGDTTSFDTYRELIDNGLFPHQRRVSPDDAGPHGQNNSLLVTGQLMWDPKLPGIGFDSMAKQLLQRFAAMSWAYDIFHAYGPVRMLLWTTRDDLRTSFPQSSRLIGKSSMYLNKVSNTTEVVQPLQTPRRSVGTSSGREPRYTLQSLVRAMKVARENGLELPTHRRTDIHDFANDVEKMTNGTGIIDIAKCTEYLKNQQLSGKSTVGLVPESVIRSYLEQEARAKDPKKFYDHEAIKSSKHDVVMTEEGRLATVRKGTRNHFAKQAVQKDAIVDIGEAIYHLECQVLGTTSQTQKESALESLKKLNHEFEEAVRLRNENVRQQVFSDLDDRIGLCSPVPPLRWDARPFEPLVMQPDEAWPRNRVSLVDVEPKPIPEGQSAESLEYFQDFLLGLLWRPAATLPEALGNIQSGAGEIIDQVPILRDPARGGRLDMNHLRVRMLTLEMIDELCKAYREWPFRSPDANHSKYFKLKIGGSQTTRS